jgi:hypothetical protein
MVNKNNGQKRIMVKNIIVKTRMSNNINGQTMTMVKQWTMVKKKNGQNNNGQTTCMVKQRRKQQWSQTSVVVVASAVVVAKRVAGYFTRSPSPLRQTFTHRQSPGQSNRVANSVAGSPTLVQAPLDAAIAARPTIRASASQCVVATVAVVASAVAGTIVFAPSNAAPNAREICVASAEPLVAHAIPVALLWARHQPARLALPANVAQTTVGGAGAVVGTLLRAEDRFCAAVTSPTEVARACIRRVVADTWKSVKSKKTLVLIILVLVFKHKINI